MNHFERRQRNRRAWGLLAVLAALIACSCLPIAISAGGQFWIGVVVWLSIAVTAGYVASKSD